MSEFPAGVGRQLDWKRATILGDEIRPSFPSARPLLGKWRNAALDQDPTEHI